MRIRLLAILGVVALAVGVQAQVRDAFQGILPVTDPAMKRSLNGEWHLKVTEGIDDSGAVRRQESDGKIP